MRAVITSRSETLHGQIFHDYVIFERLTHDTFYIARLFSFLLRSSPHFYSFLRIYISICDRKIRQITSFHIHIPFGRFAIVKQVLLNYTDCNRKT